MLQAILYLLKFLEECEQRNNYSLTNGGNHLFQKEGKK